MKTFFNLLLAMLVVLGVACTPQNTETMIPDNGDENNGNTAALTFDIDIRNVSWNGAMVEIFPSNNTDTYYFDVVEKTVYDQYDNDEAFINDKIAELKAKCETDGMPLEEILSQYSDGYYYEKLLTPVTEYYVYVFGVTDEGVATTELTTKAFTTLAVGGGGNDAPAGIDKGDITVDCLTWGSFMNIDDYYGVGVGTWLVVLSDESGRGTFTIELQKDLSANSFLGEYLISKSFDAGVAIAGALDYREYVYGTTWLLYDDTEDFNFAEMAFCQSGTVTIDKEGKNYIINVDAIDEFGNTVKTSYVGELYDNTPDYTSLAR